MPCRISRKPTEQHASSPAAAAGPFHGITIQCAVSHPTSQQPPTARTYEPPFLVQLHALCPRVAVAIVRGQQLVAAGPLAQAAPPATQPGAQARQRPWLLIRVLVRLDGQVHAVAGGAREERHHQRNDQHAGELAAAAAARSSGLACSRAHQVRPADESVETRKAGVCGRRRASSSSRFNM